MRLVSAALGAATSMASVSKWPISVTVDTMACVASAWSVVLNIPTWLKPIRQGHHITSLESLVAKFIICLLKQVHTVA